MAASTDRYKDTNDFSYDHLQKPIHEKFKEKVGWAIFFCNRSCLGAGTCKEHENTGYKELFNKPLPSAYSMVLSN